MSYLRRTFDNTPDDWGSHWNKCGFCGKRYHASDGGCDCTESYPDCACGENKWEIHHPIAFCSDGDVRCSNCGSAPGDKEWVFEKEDEEEDDGSRGDASG